MFQRRILAILILALGMIYQASCSKSSDGGSAAGEVISLYKAAFPEEAAISSPTAQKSASASTLIKTESDFNTLADAGDTADKKKEALTTLLDGATSEACSVNINLYSSGNANCYGPNLQLSGTHPDTSLAPNPSSLPGGDLGLWDAAESSGEACSAAELNSRMKGVASQIDTAFFTVASMLCAAKTAGLSAPASAGDSITVTTALNGKVKINNVLATVNSATLARGSDTNGKPVYLSTINATVGTKTVFIRLKHVPAGVQDETTFTGKVSVSIADSNQDSGFAGNCSGSSSGQVDGSSIIYEKTASGNMKYILKSGNFCGSSANPFVSSTNYSVDLTKTYSSNNGGWGNNANILLADFTPSSGVGTYQYAWQAGKGDSHTRVLNVKITDASNAVAYFGFGPNTISSAAPGSISGMICNWAGPGGNHNGVTKVQKQVLTRSSTYFTASSSSIVYDPVNSCESSTGSFSYNKTGQSADVDNSTTSNLVNLTDWSSTITNVSAPAEID